MIADWRLSALALAAGFTAGIIYFGGLWLTVRKLPHARHPILLALGSLAGRMAILLLPMYLTTAGQLFRVSIFLLAFLFARFLSIYRLKPQVIGVNKEGNWYGD